MHRDRIPKRRKRLLQRRAGESLLGSDEPSRAPLAQPGERLAGAEHLGVEPDGDVRLEVEEALARAKAGASSTSPAELSMPAPARRSRSFTWRTSDAVNEARTISWIAFEAEAPKWWRY